MQFMANTSFKNYRIFYNFLNLLSKKLTKFYYKKLDKARVPARAESPIFFILSINILLLIV